MKTLIITLTLLIVLSAQLFADDDSDTKQLDELQKTCLAITTPKDCIDEGYCVWTTVPEKKCSLNKSKAKSMLQDENDDKPKKKKK